MAEHLQAVHGPDRSTVLAVDYGNVQIPGTCRAMVFLRLQHGLRTGESDRDGREDTKHRLCHVDLHLGLEFLGRISNPDGSGCPAVIAFNPAGAMEREKLAWCRKYF